MGRHFKIDTESLKKPSTINPFFSVHILVNLLHIKESIKKVVLKKENCFLFKQCLETAIKRRIRNLLYTVVQIIDFFPYKLKLGLHSEIYVQLCDPKCSIFFPV